MNAQIQATTSGSIAHRLQEAIELRDISVVEFQRALADAAEEMEVRGASYAQIHHYLQGRREPTLAVIRLAARILDVREVWLAFGTGEPTEFRQDLAALGGSDADAFNQVVNAVPELESCSASTQTLFFDLIVEWMRTVSDSKGFDETVDVKRMANSLFALIALPTHCWGFTDEVYDVYLVSMMNTLRLLMAEPGTGHAWKDFAEWPTKWLPLPVVFKDGPPAKAKRTTQQAKKKRAKTKRVARKSKKRGR